MPLLLPRPCPCTLQHGISVDRLPLHQSPTDQFDPVWDVLFPREKRRILRLLIERVEWDRQAGAIDIVFKPAGIKTLAAEGRPGRRAAE